MYALAAAIVKQLAALPLQLLVLIQLTVGALAMAPFAALATFPRNRPTGCCWQPSAWCIPG